MANPWPMIEAIASTRTSFSEDNIMKLAAARRLPRQSALSLSLGRGVASYASLLPTILWSIEELRFVHRWPARRVPAPHGTPDIGWPCGECGAACRRTHR